MGQMRGSLCVSWRGMKSEGKDIGICLARHTAGGQEGEGSLPRRRARETELSPPPPPFVFEVGPETERWEEAEEKPFW